MEDLATIEGNKNDGYGKVTIGFGTSEQRELKVVNFFSATYADHRLITVSELEDESFCLVVENPVSTGRAAQDTMRLSKESFIGFMATAYFYFAAKGEDLQQMFIEAVGKANLEYDWSENLKDPFHKDNTQHPQSKG